MIGSTSHLQQVKDLSADVAQLGLDLHLVGGEVFQVALLVLLAGSDGLLALGLLVLKLLLHHTERLAGEDKIIHRSEKARGGWGSAAASVRKVPSHVHQCPSKGGPRPALLTGGGRKHACKR